MTVKKERNPDGTFRSGNVVCKGSRKRVPKSLLKSAVTDQDFRDLLTAGLKKAKGGDDSWAQWLLSRRIPAVRAIAPPVQVDLDLTNLDTALRSILQSVADGELSSDQGRDLISAVQGVAVAVKIEELQERMEEITRQLNERAGHARLTAV
ncbi:hypothetical protein CWI75_10720 [Kineobactrum sediminis]|uniref:Uncharacterized protein n=1 Tax=Kineobactrum sediminis TaxID=1905677 RepID=A0A2N5Y1I1_9GAMM|nr:hypothetical protein [Kineobactrum sediminis]PLW82243.1 hypothetical protein CWI75_10720 [Kineobactrum sediminis]